MARYEVTHRLGLYVCGLGSRPFGGVFDISREKASRLRLDDNPNLKRVDGRAARKTEPEPEANNAR